jgi:hypothetical protein
VILLILDHVGDVGFVGNRPPFKIGTELVSILVIRSKLVVTLVNVSRSTWAVGGDETTVLIRAAHGNGVLFDRTVVMGKLSTISQIVVYSNVTFGKRSKAICTKPYQEKNGKDGGKNGDNKSGHGVIRKSSEKYIQFNIIKNDTHIRNHLVMKFPI